MRAIRDRAGVRMSGDGVALAPLADLLVAHAGRAAAWHRAVWAFDARLAHVARTTREPAIGQMRLAWWHDVITDAAGIRGRGEPVVDALRESGAIGAPGLVAMLDGWDIIVVEPEIDRAQLLDYAIGRGGGLFRALARAEAMPGWLIAAGQVWALWDVSGHVGDDALADAALTLARALLPDADGGRWPRGAKPLRIAYHLARADVLAGRRAPAGVTRAMAMRLLRIALVGR